MNAKQTASLKHLGGLTELGRIGRDASSQCCYETNGTDNGIQLFQMGVTDSDMKHFALLPEWHVITLRETNISDKGFRHLSNQDQLRFLDIAETNITSLHPIRNAIHLEQLWVDRLEGLTDRKAAALKNFRKLKFLDLGSTGILDAGLKHLQGMDDLRKLNLVHTKITDDGLRSVGTLPALEMLGLYYTRVSDDGLRHLHAIDTLRLLVTGETNVTPKGKMAIKKAIPGLKVVDYEGIY